MAEDCNCGVADMTTISKIDEDEINNNLKFRYQNDFIYTYTGSILLAVNPYKKLGIFSKEHAQKYHTKKLGTLEPHVFAIAEAAYRSIVDDQSNQSCIISGESGAGKTETTKFILQYLCAVTSNVSTWAQQQILEANTVLEAFGNAKTVRNDNSSRFGKFLQVCFDSKHCIKGCIIQDYLLERSRITFQSNGERNYHVFYQLVAQGSKNDDMRELYHLKSLHYYKYLNTLETIEFDVEAEAKKFESLTMAFTILQIEQTAIDGIFKVLSSILWLGNLEFLDMDGEKCEIKKDDEITLTIAELLGINVNDLLQVLLRRQINVRGTITEIPLKLSEARENRHAMAMALYSQTFAWLVYKINSCTNPGQESKLILGVLDIFGFENFRKNSFEQLCINYTNEKLHKFFNHYVFALEQEIYESEEITYCHVDFSDNSLCLELIEKPPRCIFKLLTEQCHMPKGTDSAYLSNLHCEFEFNPYYLKSNDRRLWETEFGIRHYAGAVLYSVQGFVDKNRDVQQDVLFDFMSRSNNLFIQTLSTFQECLPTTNTSTLSSTNSRGTSKTKFTVSDKFRQQLQALVDVLQSTKLWYVRCIKPNAEKLPEKYNEVFVLDQLKYLGILDIVRIRKEGYPIHLDLNNFMSKYQCLLKNEYTKDVKQFTSKVLQNTNLPTTDWQIGKTKVFLRSNAYENLEDTRKNIICKSAIIIQKNWRCFVHFKCYQRLRKSALIVQHAYQGWKIRIVFLQKRRAAIVIQSRLRGVFAREVAAALRELRRVEEEIKRKEREANKIAEMESVQECEKLVKEEINVLCQMSKHIQDISTNNKPVGGLSNSIDSKTYKDQIATIGFDDMLAMLKKETADLTPNEVFREINEEINSLVHDFDKEIENKRRCAAKSTTTEHVKKKTINVGIPSLPEPTMPPPPPPPPQDINFLESLNNHSNSYVDKKPEPIYEAVVPNSNSPKRETKIVCEYLKDVTPINTYKINNVLNDTKSPHQKLEVNNQRDQRRKHRVEKKLQEMHQNLQEVQLQNTYFDIIEFAENNFNKHDRTLEGTIMSTLTRRGKKLDTIPVHEMTTFLRGEKIPTSHLHMYDPENVALSTNIFRELCKYMKGEFSSERELQAVQYIIGLGIEREELRDEIFVQCMRQITNNPSTEWIDRLWLLMCLIIVAFQPSKLLFRYFVSYLKRNMESLNGKIRQYAQWCFDNCKCVKVLPRVYPPSSVEIAAMRRLGTIVCRFFFLDGRTKAIDVHPMDTAGDAVVKLADKLNLGSTDGWAIFQSRSDGEEYIKSFDYLYDIIALWELKQTKIISTATSDKQINNTSCSSENRFVFKKRLFKSTKILSQDPVEVSMLYAQAVHSVVKCDDFPVSERVALQLAGLQAQVALGDPSNPNKLEYYADVNNFLPKRISQTREKQFWIPILAQAHRQFGASRNELTAKVLYLSCVMQYPLYGTTMFQVTFKGFWNFPYDILLGVNNEGLLFVQPEDKFVIFQFRYNDIESIILDPSDSFITISVNKIENNQQMAPKFGATKCFVFETVQKNEIGSLITSYYPALSSWLSHNFDGINKYKGITTEDRCRLYQNVVICRRQLIDSDFLAKPQDTGGFLKNTLRKLSIHRLEKLRAEQTSIIQDHGETYKGFSYTFWTFSKQPLTLCLSKLSDQDEILMLQIFHSILTYSGLGATGEKVEKAEDERITIVQSIMERCMRKESSINELYLQLIKQTTDHPDPNSRINLRHWAFLSLACSVFLPTFKPLRKYLIAHLKRCGSDYLSEEGKFARFAEICLLKTQGARRRQWPPSREEVLYTINRRPCYAKIYFMDGRLYSIEFHSSSTSNEVIEMIKKKIGLQESAKGFALYEISANFERSLMPEEKLTDVMAKWERHKLASQNHCQNNGLAFQNIQNQIFLFKKHLLYDQYINLDDPVENELFYHQILYSLRSERFPISEMEAIMLVALQGQLELGDSTNQFSDYKVIASHCLPPRFVQNIPHEAVALHHQSLRGMLPNETKKAFLNLIQSWPLHRATIFDVTQTFTSNWPRTLWLAVDQNGIHLLEYRSRNVLCTHDYEAIMSFSPKINSVMIFTGTEKKQSKVILNTSQAFQIASLMKEYSNIWKQTKNMPKTII